ESNFSTSHPCKLTYPLLLSSSFVTLAATRADSYLIFFFKVSPKSSSSCEHRHSSHGPPAEAQGDISQSGCAQDGQNRLWRQRQQDVICPANDGEDGPQRGGGSRKSWR